MTIYKKIIDFPVQIYGFFKNKGLISVISYNINEKIFQEALGLLINF